MAKLKKLKNQDLPVLISRLPTPEERLARLQYLAGLGGFQNSERRQTMRKKFDGAKDILYDIEFQACLVCDEKAAIRHHILMLKRKGGNGRKNICYLCRDCHAEIHLWLKK